ncbi:RING finger protein 44-like [Pseudophryne corroboree]|uniref:RING finger protein 44-like n=1 Tax=Pseudophryne corroboree TaxID=495146 RepID=UPI00308202CE
MSGRRELRRLLEDQRSWSRLGDHDDSPPTVFEERLRSERRRGAITRQNTQEYLSRGETSAHLQTPQREHRHRSRSPLPAPETAPRGRPSPDPLPGPSHLHPASQQPAENEQNVSATLQEAIMQNIEALVEANDGQNLQAMLEESFRQNMPALVEEMNRQNLQSLTVDVSYFPFTIIAEDEARQSCVICLMEYEAGERVSVLPCSHKYHPSCISEWYETNSSCPLCRSECTPRRIRCQIS